MHILCLQCEDKPGIVAAVATTLSNAQCNIEESAQFNDPFSGQFFMRVVFSPLVEEAQQNFRKHFEHIAQQFCMRWSVHVLDNPVKTMVMVSKEGHCLNEILYRWRSKNLSVYTGSRP